jgi:sugar phosphate isomerase/epimerase
MSQGWKPCLIREDPLQMQLWFFCPLWGSSDLAWGLFFARVKEAGYDGVEMSLPLDEREQKLILSLLKEHDLKWVAQHWQTNDPEPSVYLKNYERHLYHLASAHPLFINSQSGKDFFSFAQNKAILERAAAIAEETGVKIIHETHRGRFSFSTTATLAFLEALPDLRLTADFSHWCNVAESFLQDQPDAMRAAVARADHIHARVGFPQGPQVNDPRAPEWEEALDHHLAWWDAVVAEHRRRKSDSLTITPEFGPAPYMPAMPYSREPLSNQWEVNLYMKDLLRARYSE